MRCHTARRGRRVNRSADTGNWWSQATFELSIRRGRAEQLQHTSSTTTDKDGVMRVHSWFLGAFLGARESKVFLCPAHQPTTLAGSTVSPRQRRRGCDRSNARARVTCRRSPMRRLRAGPRRPGRLPRPKSDNTQHGGTHDVTSAATTPKSAQAWPRNAIAAIRRYPHL